LGTPRRWSLAVCFGTAAGLRRVGRPFEWLGLGAVGFGPGVIRRDPAVPTAHLRRLPDRSQPPRAKAQTELRPRAPEIPNSPIMNFAESP
jgi:hypothetical protein